MYFDDVPIEDLQTMCLEQVQHFKRLQRYGMRYPERVRKQEVDEYVDAWEEIHMAFQTHPQPLPFLSSAARREFVEEVRERWPEVEFRPLDFEWMGDPRHTDPDFPRRTTYGSDLSEPPLQTLAKAGLVLTTPYLMGVFVSADALWFARTVVLPNTPPGPKVLLVKRVGGSQRLLDAARSAHAAGCLSQFCVEIMQVDPSSADRASLKEPT